MLQKHYAIWVSISGADANAAQKKTLSAESVFFVPNDVGSGLLSCDVFPRHESYAS